MNLILTILSALGSFIVTNIDDIFVLMLLFSQASSQAKASNGRTVNMQPKGNRIYPRDIVIGQYLGFALLVLISLLAMFIKSLLYLHEFKLERIAPSSSSSPFINSLTPK